MPQKMILASSSPFRQQLMKNAGLSFSAFAANVDERVVEAPLIQAGAEPQAIATALAEAKALDVSARADQALVIGSDQVLSLEGSIFHKCGDMAEARDRLIMMSGQTHFLDSAIAIARDEQIVWRHVSRATMHFRSFDETFVDHYLAMAGEGILSSVGAYQFEGPGIQLFNAVEGDYFAIIGLPLIPLLTQLREMKAIPA